MSKYFFPAANVSGHVNKKGPSIPNCARNMRNSRDQGWSKVTGEQSKERPGMEKTEFQKIEGKLVAFFRARTRRNRIKDLLEAIETRINQVEGDLGNLRITIPIPSLTANYSGVAVTGGEHSSYLERALIKQEEKLSNELVLLKIRRARMGQKLRELVSAWEGMEVILADVLDEEEMLIARIKYSNFRVSYREIAWLVEQETGVRRSPNTIKDKRERIVRKVAEELRAA